MSVEDAWFTLDRQTGKKVPTKRHGRGKRWRVRNRIGGSEVVKSFTKKTEAEDYDIHVRSQLQQGITPFDPARGRMTFRAYTESWLPIQHFAPSTRSTNAGYLKNHLLPFLGDLQLGQIEHSTVTAWLAQMRTKPNPRGGGVPYSASTVELVYILLCTIMASAVNDKRIPVSPCKDVPYPKAPQRPELVVWEGEVVDTLLTAVPDPHHALLLLAGHCGHRQGEAFAVSAEDILAGEISISHQIQRVDGHLALVPCKHSSVRTAPLPQDVADALGLHLQRYPTISMPCTCPRKDHQGKTWQLLFHDRLPDYTPAPRGRPLLAAQWNEQVWHPTLRAAKLDPGSPDKTGLHMLRHYCASEWIAGGATLTEVQKWLGHKSVSTTEQIYAHLFKRASNRGRQIMDGVFAARRERTLRAVGAGAYPLRTGEIG